MNGVEVVERGSEIVIRSAGAVTIGDTGRRDSSDPSAVIQAIRSLWATAGFRSTKVVVALPPEAVYLKWLNLEAGSEEDLAHTATVAATRGAPFPQSDAIVDYRVLASRGSSSTTLHFVMLVASSASAVDNLLDIVEAAGLEPVAVDISAAAALRSLAVHRHAVSPLWSGQPLAHCVVGARSTTIALLRGGELEFARSVPIGGNDLTQCIADATGVSWADAERIKSGAGARLIDNAVILASHGSEQVKVACDSVLGRLGREITRSLRFFRSQFAEGSYLGMIGAATLSGGGALLRGMDACLQEQGIEVTNTVNPFAGFSVAAEGAGIQHIGDSAPAYTTAMGLALGDYWSAESALSAAA